MHSEHVRKHLQTAVQWQAVWPRQTGLSERAAALLTSQSLTRVLRGLEGEFSVRLLHLGLGTSGGFWPVFDHGGSVFVREVQLCLNGEAVVWARSACAADSVFWRGLLDCGTQPLGERLFDGSLPLIRSPLEYAAGTPSGGDDSAQRYFHTAFAARRSLFTAENGGILGLAECFLPALKAYLP